MPEERLNDSAAFPWLEGTSPGGSLVGGGFFSHLAEEHEPDLQVWLNCLQR